MKARHLFIPFTMALAGCLSAPCRGNPIVVENDVNDNGATRRRDREIQMTHEEVILRIAPDSTAVSGDYTFNQPGTVFSKRHNDAFHILLPVYVADYPDRDRSFAGAKRIYAPKLTIEGKTYEPTSTIHGPPLDLSAFSDAGVIFVTFEFEVPCAGIPNIFQVHASYTQPHMVVGDRSYACYCPFRPAALHPLKKPVNDDQFTLRAIAQSGLRVQRISENKKPVSDAPEAVTVRCLDQEHILLRVEKDRPASQPVRSQ